jgi:phage terminase large subunit
LERHTELPTRAAYKDVSTGIEAVQVRLRKRRLFIFKNARVHPQDQKLADAHKPTSTATEIPGYIWYERKNPAGISVVKEGPVKEDDHGCDAMRYMVAHRDLAGVPMVRWA